MAKALKQRPLLVRLLPTMPQGRLVSSQKMASATPSHLSPDTTACSGLQQEETHTLSPDPAPICRGACYGDMLNFSSCSIWGIALISLKASCQINLEQISIIFLKAYLWLEFCNLCLY